MNTSFENMTKVPNKARKFGAARQYIYCEINNEPALFTEKQILIAKMRASKNPEDLPAKKSFWQKIFS